MPKKMKKITIIESATAKLVECSYIIQNSEFARKSKYKYKYKLGFVFNTT